MTNIFVISNIHVHYKQFEKLLSIWNEKDKLVFLGDLIDRGPDSLRVIEKVMALKQIYGKLVTFIKGNLEDMLLLMLVTIHNSVHLNRRPIVTLFVFVNII